MKVNSIAQVLANHLPSEAEIGDIPLEIRSETSCLVTAIAFYPKNSRMAIAL